MTYRERWTIGMNEESEREIGSSGEREKDRVKGLRAIRISSLVLEDMMFSVIKLRTTYELNYLPYIWHRLQLTRLLHSLTRRKIF